MKYAWNLISQLWIVCSIGRIFNNPICSRARLSDRFVKSFWIHSFRLSNRNRNLLSGTPLHRTCCGNLITSVLCNVFPQIPGTTVHCVDAMPDNCDFCVSWTWTQMDAKLRAAPIWPLAFKLTRCGARPHNCACSFPQFDYKAVTMERQWEFALQFRLELLCINMIWQTIGRLKLLWWRVRSQKDSNCAFRFRELICVFVSGTILLFELRVFKYLFFLKFTCSW